ncbi:agmatine deiminase family protein [Fibrisoma montanum]|uniref:Agmatine deiminase family protein n=1 Tax=Fibrisoma montanum TaxID=2305895 RepID=A0A418MAZ0_9BACT|nr:agmatine deiminase family protein [Fibrisoma montanum]RIV23542.1 agmatine deiminase family protein [Fibrisoma montanum]
MNTLPFRLLVLTALSVLTASCQKEDFGVDQPHDSGKASADKFYVPAEFEPLASIWLSAPTTRYKSNLPMWDVQAAMIKEILPTSTKIDYAINGPSDIDSLTTYLVNRGVSQGAIQSGIRFHTVPHGDLWIRDTGGTFMKSKKEKEGYRVVDFDFDAYRMKGYVSADTYALYQLDNNVSYGIGAAKGATIVSSPLITEGGNLHFNGKGTVIAIKKSLLASNPGLTLAEIEAELKRVFNLKKVIFLNETTGTDSHPVLESPKLVNGGYQFNLGVWHADEMVTWVDPRTVIVAQVPAAELSSGNPFKQQSYQALEDAYQVLRSATDQDGKPLTILRAPEPSPIVVELGPNDVMYQFLQSLNGIQHFPTDGSPIKFVMAASYMNYVVTNDVVLIPKFYKPGRASSLAASDEEFRQLIQSVYPNRQVKQIDADGITVGGGGMHCITQQVPSLDKHKD